MGKRLRTAWTSKCLSALFIFRFCSSEPHVVTCPAVLGACDVFNFKISVSPLTHLFRVLLPSLLKLGLCVVCELEFFEEL